MSTPDGSVTYGRTAKLNHRYSTLDIHVSVTLPSTAEDILSGQALAAAKAACQEQFEADLLEAADDFPEFVNAIKDKYGS